MSMNDPVLDQLRELPPLDLERTQAEALRRQARAVMAETHGRSRLAHTWSSVLEPAVVALAIVVYAGWGLSTISSLFRTAEPAAEVSVAAAHSSFLTCDFNALKAVEIKIAQVSIAARQQVTYGPVAHVSRSPLPPAVRLLRPRFEQVPLHARRRPKPRALVRSQLQHPAGRALPLGSNARGLSLGRSMF